MFFLGVKYLEDEDSKPIKCWECGSLITVVECLGHSGFNFQVRYYCQRCADWNS